MRERLDEHCRFLEPVQDPLDASSRTAEWHRQASEILSAAKGVLGVARRCQDWFENNSRRLILFGVRIILCTTRTFSDPLQRICIRAGLLSVPAFSVTFDGRLRFVRYKPMPILTIPNQVYEPIKALYGAASSILHLVRNSSGTFVKDRDDILYRAEHFCSLLNQRHSADACFLNAVLAQPTVDCLDDTPTWKRKRSELQSNKVEQSTQA